MAKKTEYAGFWIRFVATIIDSLVLAIPMWLLMMGLMMPLMVGGAFIDPNNPNPAVIMQFVGTLFVLIFFSIVGQWLYEALMTSSPLQATLGKMALGLIITDEKGKRMSFARATGRHFAKHISGMILLIGYIMAAFTEKKQALHDMIASTVVIKK